MSTRTMTARATGDRDIEGRDSVGLYLDEIARTPLLDAVTEVELAKTIEAGLYAQHLLETGRIGRRKGGAPKSATREELEWLVEEGERAVDTFYVTDLLGDKIDSKSRLKTLEKRLLAAASPDSEQAVAA